MHVRRKHESLLKECGLPHTVAEWYVRREHESLPKEYGLPHTVAEWYVRHKHKILPIKMDCLNTWLSLCQDRGENTITD